MEIMEEKYVPDMIKMSVDEQAGMAFSLKKMSFIK